MNPILCVTDFTELTVAAVRVATAFAEAWNERVVLVRSVDEREQFPFGVRSSLVQEDWRRLEEEAQQIRALGFEVEEKVLRGMPEDGVAQFAWNCGARLIVVGSTPTGKLDRWALGCLAEEIAATSLVPILAVRSATPFDRWRAGERPLSVFVGLDPVARPDAVLNRLDELRLAGPCTLAASFLPYPEHAHTPSAPTPAAYRDHEFATEPDFSAALSRELLARQASIGEFKRGKDLEAALVDSAGGAGADLLVITSRPHTDLTLLAPRCLARGVLRRAPMSVLCVPEAAVEPPRGAPPHERSTDATPGGQPPPQRPQPHPAR